MAKECLLLSITALAGLLGCSQEQPTPASDLYRADRARLQIHGNPRHDFGMHAIGTSVSAVFTIENAGLAAATEVTGSMVMLAFQFLGEAFPGASGDCGPTIWPGEICDFEIEFAPTYSGAFESIVRIRYFDSKTYRTTDDEFPQLTVVGRAP